MILQPWFDGNCSRLEAEEKLAKVSIDGAFLVRPGERVLGSFAITFRAENKIKHCLIKQEGRLFIIGTAEFESLVELIAHYEKHPLYRKVCLKIPVNEELLSRYDSSRESNGSGAGREPPYVSSVYFDPNNLSSTTKVKALYNYEPQRGDELNLVKNCVITNVVKQNKDWWKGDFGGNKQYWFPANHVQEIETVPAEQEEPSNEIMPLGSLQKGSFDIVGVTVDIKKNTVHPAPDRNKLEWLIHMAHPITQQEFEVGAETRDEALQWAGIISDTGKSASHREDENRKKERAMRIARELSNLVIYCRSVVFQPERYQKRTEGRCFQEMSSFPETKAERFMMPNLEASQMFLWYHQVQLSRIYPKAQRVDSSNYNPMSMWNVGSQMAALNFQTGDKPMQLNAARFMINGGCGYVLRPNYMFESSYNPYDPASFCSDAKLLVIRILAARHLTRKSRKGMVSPYIEVEICGADYDNAKYKTKTVHDNGFNPVWDEVFDFKIQKPDLALLRYADL